MNDDPLFEQMRRDAESLRYQPADEFLWTRLRSRVRERVRLVRREGVAHLLAGWFRPVAASLAAVAIVGSLAAGYLARDTPDTSTLEAMTSSPDLSSTLDDVYTLSE